MSVMTAEETLPATANGRKRWTRTNVEFLENSGLLTGRYELLDGEIVLKTGQNRRHALAVTRVVAYLLEIFGAERLQIQATMEVREDDRITNRPEPDVVALREAIDRNASGTDVLLAVEISDSTQSDDLNYKVKLYARAGVEEYWVLDTVAGKLFVFRQPNNESGEWKHKPELTGGDTIAPVSAPDHSVMVAYLLRWRIRGAKNHREKARRNNRRALLFYGVASGFFRGRPRLRGGCGGTGGSAARRSAARTPRMVPPFLPIAA